MFNFIKDKVHAAKKFIEEDMEDKKKLEEKRRAHIIREQFSNSLFELLTNATMTDRIQVLLEKPFKKEFKDITEIFIMDEDRKELISYLSIPAEEVTDKTGEGWDHYAKNLILIINLFFEYGYKGKAPFLHYWNLIEQHFSA